MAQTKFNFREVAISETSLSPLMEGKDRLTVDDVISQYPQGITVDGFDLMNGDKGKYAICTFAEDATKFFFGGSILTKIVEKWVAGFDGDIEQASHVLKDSGGVKMQLKHGKTKNGNNLTLVDVL